MYSPCKSPQLVVSYSAVGERAESPPTPHEALCPGREDERPSPGRALASGRWLVGGAAPDSAPLLRRGGPSGEQANNGVLQEDKEVDDELQ